jgi:hypothetical protein
MSMLVLGAGPSSQPKDRQKNRHPEYACSPVHLGLQNSYLFPLVLCYYPEQQYVYLFGQLPFGPLTLTLSPKGRGQGEGESAYLEGKYLSLPVINCNLFLNDSNRQSFFVARMDSSPKKPAIPRFRCKFNSCEEPK